MGWKKFSARDVEGMTDRLVVCTKPEDHDEAFLGGADGELCEFAARAFSAAAEIIATNHQGETRALNQAYRFAGAGRIALEVFSRRLIAREQADPSFSQLHDNDRGIALPSTKKS